jgi:hypothetical protein
MSLCDSGLVERTVGEERFSGGFLEQDFVGAEKLVHLVSLFERNKKEFAVSGPPDLQQIG